MCKRKFFPIYNYLDIILINVISLIIGLILFYCFKQEGEILAAIIATGISLSLGVKHYKIENDKLFKDLFTEFNSKYDSKYNDELQLILEKYRLDNNHKLNDGQIILIVDYLNFCAEEYLWRTKGRIPDSVWNAWENGMMYYFKQPLINEILIKEKSQKGSYYGLYQYIEKRKVV